MDITIQLLQEIQKYKWQLFLNDQCINTDHPKITVSVDVICIFVFLVWMSSVYILGAHS